MVRSVGRGLDPSAGGCPGDGRWREVSRGVGDAAPYGLPGEGRRREPAPHPALRGHLPPRGKARAAGEGFIPPGEGRQRKVAAGGGHPALRMGIWKRPRGLRGHPFPGRRAVGAGHARPGGLRRPPSMVRSVGRGLDPSAGCWRQRESPQVATRGRAAAQASAGRRERRPPTGCPGMGGDGSLPLIRPCGATFPRGGRQGLYGGSGSLPPTPAAGPRCGAGGSGCSTSGLTKPAQYRRNLGRCRGGSRQ